MSAGPLLNAEGVSVKQFPSTNGVHCCSCSGKQETRRRPCRDKYQTSRMWWNEEPEIWQNYQSIISGWQINDAQREGKSMLRKWRGKKVWVNLETIPALWLSYSTWGSYSCFKHNSCFLRRDSQRSPNIITRGQDILHEIVEQIYDGIKQGLKELKDLLQI